MGKWLEKAFPIHQSILFPGDFMRQQPYDSRFKISADGMVKAIAFASLKHNFVDKCLIVFHTGGVSSDYGRLTTVLRQARETIGAKTFLRRRITRATRALQIYMKFLCKYLLYKSLGRAGYERLLKRVVYTRSAAPENGSL